MGNHTVTARVIGPSQVTWSSGVLGGAVGPACRLAGPVVGAAAQMLTVATPSPAGVQTSDLQTHILVWLLQQLGGPQGSVGFREAGTPSRSS